MTAWRDRFRAPRSEFPTWGDERPDRLVYLSDHIGRFEVFAWDSGRGAHRQVTDRPEGTGYRVSSRVDPTGEEIWWWNDRKGDEHGTWMVEPFEGGERRGAAPLLPSYSAGLAIGNGLAVIGRSSGDEGTTIDLVPRGDRPLRLYEHREWASVRHLSVDGTLLAIEHSEHGDSRNPAVRVLDLAGNKVTERWDGPGKGLRAGRWSPIPGDARLIVYHERDGAFRPLILDVRRATERPLEIDLPGEVPADWYRDGRSLLLIHHHRGRTELYRHELDGGRVELLPTEPGYIADARVRPDGEVWYQWSGSTAPAQTRSGTRTVLRAPGPEAPESVRYADLDVRGIHGFVAEPRTGARPRPTLFHVHGGPEAHDSDTWSPTVQAWVDHGFAVVMVNYRGSSGYGKAWRDAIRGKPGLTELEDLGIVHAWAIASGLADPRRCVIGGASWGGYLTLLGLGVQPERWAAGLAIVPIGDYVAAFEDEMEPLKRYDAALFGGTPEQIPQVYLERSPITYVDRVRAPVLLLVGQNDPRCPPRSAEIYIKRLEELAKPHEVYRYDAGHGSLVVDEQIKQVEMQIAFLAKHLGTKLPIG